MVNEPIPYDPDNAPEGGASVDFVGKIVESVYVEDQAHASRLSPEIGKSYGDYAAKVTRTVGPIWFLKAEGISVVRSDGKPFIQTDLLTLTDKNGSWLGKNQAPATLGGQYQTLGVSASYVKVGQADSAVGRIFHFVGHDTNPGKIFNKVLRLWPVEIYPEGYVYDGEVRTVSPRSEEEAGDAPAEPIAAGLTEQEAVATLQRILTGKPVGHAFELIMGEASLKATGTVLGVGLLEAAADGSLGKVLEANGVLGVRNDVFVDIATFTAATPSTEPTPI